MNDNDTKQLGLLYDSVGGILDYGSTLLTESTVGDITRLNEDMVNVLGIPLSNQLISFVTKIIPKYSNSKIIEEESERFIQIIKNTATSSIVRAFNDYKDVKSSIKLSAIYQLL